MKGHITIPILPMWNIEKLRNALINFDFKNNVIVSHVSGQESKVIVTGHTMTTEAQKTFSVESPEAKLLKELIASQTTDSTLVSSKKIAELEEIVRIQASTLDKVAFETEFVNMPKNFGIVEKTIPQTVPALNMKIVTPRETLVFKNIRIVYPLDLFFPLTAIKNNAVLGISQVTSGSVLASGSAV